MRIYANDDVLEDCSTLVRDIFDTVSSAITPLQPKTMKEQTEELARLKAELQQTKTQLKVALRNQPSSSKAGGSGPSSGKAAQLLAARLNEKLGR